LSDPTLIALLVFLGAVVASRLLSESGLAKLEPDEKVQLMDAFAAQRKYSLMGVVGILAVGVLLRGAVPAVLFMVVLGFYAVGMSAYSVSKVRRLGMPITYVGPFIAGQLLQIGGLAVYFAAVSGWFSERGHRLTPIRPIGVK